MLARKVLTIILLHDKRIIESSVADPDMGSGILDPVFFYT